MAQAAQILDFLHGLPLLTPRAKAGVLGLLRKTLLCADEDFVATTSAGISIFRDVKDVALNRIYRVSGTGFVEADPQVGKRCTVAAAAAGVARTHDMQLRLLRDLIFPQH